MVAVAAETTQDDGQQTSTFSVEIQYTVDG